jgi:GGDEF domain-containing protein
MCDALTGLPEPRAVSRARRAFSEVRPEQSRFHFAILVDLVGSKPINDRLEHKAGDAVATPLGQTLSRLFAERRLVPGTAATIHIPHQQCQGPRRRDPPSVSWRR